MTIRAVIGLILAVAFLISQTLGVAAHCESVADGTGHEHHAGDDVASADDNSQVVHGSAAVPGHVHLQSDDPMNDFDVDLLAGDCSLGFVGVGPEPAHTVEPLNPGEALSPSPQPVPTAETVNLPTPPPNTLL